MKALQFSVWPDLGSRESAPDNYCVVVVVCLGVEGVVALSDECIIVNLFS